MHKDLTSPELISTADELRARVAAARAAGRSIGLVPTMGALHAGHASLVDASQRECDLTVATIFVNPTQFGPNEDFSRYPRNFERDCELMETVPVDVLFAPEPDVMYPSGSQTWVEATDITQGLCGAHRPGHFRGVTTVVAKLFNVVKPHVALFGEKDYQQLRSIQRMVTDLNFDLEIVPVPTVRERDGLAMSSRNAYLSPEERERALALSRALEAASECFRAGACTPIQLACAARAVLERTKGLEIEYIEAVDAESLQRVERNDRPIVVAIAARVGKTRLIDNMVFARPSA